MTDANFLNSHITQVGFKDIFYAFIKTGVQIIRKLQLFRSFVENQSCTTKTQ